MGSAVPISRILDIGANVLPRVMHLALSELGTPAIRNRATLGGNICIRERRMSAFPVYLLLDIQLELKRAGTTRWIPLSRFAPGGGKIDLQRSEVLTRIRIPFAAWDFEVYRRINRETSDSADFLSFCGLARTEKNVIQDIRIAYGTAGSEVIRSREIENELVGRKLPIGKRELGPIMEILDAALALAADALTSFKRERIRSLLGWFLAELPDR